jgi:hypothetical protein
MLPAIIATSQTNKTTLTSGAGFGSLKRAGATTPSHEYSVAAMRDTNPKIISASAISAKPAKPSPPQPSRQRANTPGTP